MRFTAWWANIESAIFALGRKYLRSTDVAEDLAQDVAIGALLNFSNFHDRDHFEAWTLKRARWLALNRLHFERRREKSSVDTLEEKASAATQDEAALLSEVLEIISRFPPQQKTVLQMTFEGRTTSEIASKLGISSATVR